MKSARELVDMWRYLLHCAADLQRVLDKEDLSDYAVEEIEKTIRTLNRIAEGI